MARGMIEETSIEAVLALISDYAVSKAGKALELTMSIAERRML
jgi:hypothetical protein